MKQSPALNDRRDTGMGRLVQRYLDAQYEVLVAEERPLRRGEHDVIHKTRVAARRYRTVLRDFTDLFDSPESVILEESLRWYAGVLGEVRDLRVGRGELAPFVAKLPDDAQGRQARTVLEAYLSRRESDALDALSLALDSRRHQRMVDQLTVRHQNLLADHRPDEVVGRYLKHAERRLNRRIEEAAEHGNPEELVHDARKAAKRARYVAELSEPVLGPRARALARRLTKLQDELGARQDQAVARALLVDLAQTHRSNTQAPMEGSPQDARTTAELLDALMQETGPLAAEA